MKALLEFCRADKDSSPSANAVAPSEDGDVRLQVTSSIPPVKPYKSIVQSRFFSPQSMERPFRLGG